jgi:hypothetical protein
MVQCLFDDLDVLSDKGNISQKLVARISSYPELRIENRPVRGVAAQNAKDDSWTRGTKYEEI